MQPSPSASPRHRRTGALALCVLTVAATLAACGQSTPAPDQPTAVGAVPGNQSALVSWSAPDSPSGAVSYLVTALPGGHTCRTSKETCTVGGLTNGTSYQVSVRTVGSGGTSAPAVAPAVRPGTPEPPTGVQGSPGDSSVTVRWSAPAADGGSPVTGYVVSTAPGGRTCIAVLPTCLVTSLTNNTAYTFTVVANNAVGHSVPSAPGPQITPTTISGGSAGITYLGPLSASQESTTGTILQRDAGISVALPSGKDLWIFGDTSSFTATASQASAFVGGSTAAKGKYTPGKPLSVLRDIQPAGTVAGKSAPSQFIPTPSDTYMPDGSGRPCTPANGAVYTARWPTGAAMFENQQQLLVTYTDVCVTSQSSFTVEGWGFMTYSWRSGKIRTAPYDVFPPASNGAPLPADRSYQSPLIFLGLVTFYTSQCTSLYVACTAGTVSVTTVPENILALIDPASYVAKPAITDGATQWMPVNVSVAGYGSSLRMIEQTSIGGTFIIFTAIGSAAGPWHAAYSGTLPGCSTTPTGFCYAFVGHPELDLGSSMVVSYFKPDSLENANVGHVDLAAVQLSGS
jgi:hypothetical protein